MHEFVHRLEGYVGKTIRETRPATNGLVIGLPLNDDVRATLQPR